MTVFPAELVTAPVGQRSVEWLKTLTPDLLGRVPQAVAFR